MNNFLEMLFLKKLRKKYKKLDLKEIERLESLNTGIPGFLVRSAEYVPIDYKYHKKIDLWIKDGFDNRGLKLKYNSEDALNL